MALTNTFAFHAAPTSVPPLLDTEPWLKPSDTSLGSFFPVVRSSTRSVVLVIYDDSNFRAIIARQEPVVVTRPSTEPSPWLTYRAVLQPWTLITPQVRLAKPRRLLRVHRSADEDDYSPAEGLKALRQLPEIALPAGNVVRLSRHKPKG